jgi:hypothetical protein
MTFKKKEGENMEFELESKLTILYQNGGTHEEEISKLESELKNIREEKVQKRFQVFICENGPSTFI